MAENFFEVRVLRLCNFFCRLCQLRPRDFQVWLKLRIIVRLEGLLLFRPLFLFLPAFEPGPHGGLGLRCLVKRLQARLPQLVGVYLTAEQLDDCQQR